MIKKLNQFITASTESLYGPTVGSARLKKKIDTAVVYIFIGAIIYPLSFYVKWFEPWGKEMNGFITTLSLFYSFWFLITSLVWVETTPTPFKGVFGFFCHTFCLLGKKERNRQIDAFMQMRREEHALNLPDSVANCFYKNDKFMDVNNENLEQWVKTYVGNEKSFIPLFKERVLGSASLRKGILYWSQLIPRARLTIDDYRLLLKVCPIVEHSQLVGLKPIAKEKLEEIFMEYRREDIVRLFSSAFFMEDYNSILNITNQYNLTASLQVDMKDLNTWAQEMKAHIDGAKFTFPSDLPVINKIKAIPSSSLGEVTFISNTKELIYWAKAMSNCIQSYQDRIFKEKSLFFGIIKEGCPFMVLELNAKGKLIEAKKKANLELYSSEMKELKTYLKETLDV